MGALNALSVSLMKIANDLRLLASGPRTALGEITLPSLQPGSSIMPGKVEPGDTGNDGPVAARVMGSSLWVDLAGQSGPLELNMMPLIAWETLGSLSLLSRTFPGACREVRGWNKGGCGARQGLDRAQPRPGNPPGTEDRIRARGEAGAEGTGGESDHPCKWSFPRECSARRRLTRYWTRARCWVRTESFTRR